MPTEKELTGYPSVDKPWLKYYTKEAINAETPKCSIYQNIYDGNADNFSDVALLFFGKKITYKQLFVEVDKATKAFITRVSFSIQEEIYRILSATKQPSSVISQITEGG